MWWNFLVKSSLFTSWVVYCLLFSSTCGIVERESFTIMCALFLFLRRCLIPWYKRPDLVILNVGRCGLWKKNCSYLVCYKSLYCVYVTIQVIGCWISPLGYNRQEFSIQGGHQYCWCKLLLNWSVHLGIVHHKHHRCLTEIYIDEGVASWFIVKNTPIFINTGLFCSIQYVIFHTCYVGITFVAWEQLLELIYDGLHLKYFLWWGLEKWFQDMGDHPIPRWGCPSWDCIMHSQHSPFFSTPQSRDLFPYLPCFLFLNASASSLRFFCVEHSLFPA